MPNEEGSDVSDLAEAAKDLCRFFAEVRGTIIGGFAMSLIVEGRFTRDVDGTVDPNVRPFDELVSTLAQYGFVPRIQDFARVAQENMILLLKHAPTAIPIDLALGCTDFEQSMISRAIEHQIDGVTVRVATPEDIVVSKSISPRTRDLADIEALIATYPNLDKPYVLKWISGLEAVLEDPEPFEAVRKLLSGS